jgi:hypothetical protein
VRKRNLRNHFFWKTTVEAAWLVAEAEAAADSETDRGALRCRCRDRQGPTQGRMADADAVAGFRVEVGLRDSEVRKLMEHLCCVAPVVRRDTVTSARRAAGVCKPG